MPAGAQAVTPAPRTWLTLVEHEARLSDNFFHLRPGQAAMVTLTLTDEAWQTAWGVYNVTYNWGYWFRTPEAYDVGDNFRASMYMRPLSVWAIEHALRTTE